MDVRYSRSATRTLERLPTKTAALIRSKIRLLATNPEALANNVKMLTGSDGTYRLRVGNWRVLYSDNGEVLAVSKVAPRGSAYD